MKVLFITGGCNPLGGAFSTRVHSLILMASKIADVSVVSTHDPFDPKIHGVKFYYQPLPERTLSKFKRIMTYYRTDFPTIRIDEKPDIVQIETPALFGLNKQFPDAAIILDEHNFWWQLEKFNMRQGPTLKRLPFKELLIKWLLNRAKSFELNALKKSKHIIVCSEVDKAEMLKELPQISDKISYIPNCVDASRYNAKKSNKKIVLFMGSLIYFANIEALKLISKEIAPRVNAEFHILGQGKVDIKMPANVKLIGWVEDNRPYVEEANVCIAPLRHGSGTRVKILEFMAMGKAIVSTTKGAEGLEITHGKNIIIEDDMEIFADSINRLLEEDDFSHYLGQEGRKLLEEKYDYHCYSEFLKSIYKSL